MFDYYEADEGEQIEFRLIYKGPLPSESCEDATKGKKGRATEKQKLRKCFHLQLRELWQKDVGLTPDNFAQYPGPGVKSFVPVLPQHAPHAKKYIDLIADSHVRCNGNRFVPLVSINGGFTCSLDILFLRRDGPGKLVESGGDIDNRMKVLLDGLRMPIDVKELGDVPIEKDEDPFYCLLEDDKLITKLSVTTDRLILPKEQGDHENDVVLVIHVTMV